MDVLDVSSVLKYFSLFSDLAWENAEKWTELCGNAKACIERRMKDSCGSHDYERLCQAAGGLAYCDYLLVSNAFLMGSNEVKVGDITVKNASDSISKSELSELRGEFIAQVADLLKPENVFMAVGSGVVENSGN